MLPDKSYRSICAEVVRLLQKERERQQLSKYAVAERSGLSQQMISYVERGLRTPSLETALRFASALDTDLGEVIKQACKVAPKSKPK